MTSVNCDYGRQAARASWDARWSVTANISRNLHEGKRQVIFTSLADYEALTPALAREPAQLARSRAPLAANGAILALFDMARVTHPLHLGTLHILQRSFAEADDALLMRCRKWSKGRRAWRARNELRGVDRRALPSRRVQRKAVLRTPEPIENELFQSRRRPLVCRLVDQITHLVRILAVVV